MTNVIEQKPSIFLYMALFGTIAVLVAIDLAGDYQAGTSTAHVLFEGTIFVCATLGAAFLARQLLLAHRQTKREAHKLREQLETSREDARRWREEAQEYLRGLGEAIERQFDRWELTPAEKEVALLMLKGLSHRDIAGVRDVSERTVRQQAHTVYKKADLDGRAELSAFFLEDLLLPRDQREPLPE